MAADQRFVLSSMGLKLGRHFNWACDINARRGRYGSTDELHEREQHVVLLFRKPAVHGLVVSGGPFLVSDRERPAAVPACFDRYGQKAVSFDGDEIIGLAAGVLKYIVAGLREKVSHVRVSRQLALT